MLTQKILEAGVRFKDRPAVIGRDRIVYYEELIDSARFFARRLLDAPDSGDANVEFPLVGILLPHGAANVTAVLAAVFAGVAYVPIDPSYPDERLLFMVDHFSIRTMLVCDATLPVARDLSKTPNRPLALINLDNEAETPPVFEGEDLPVCGDNRPCYIIMTSGSSGLPKGVVQGRHNVYGLMNYYSERLEITHKDRLLYLSSFSHDGAVEDIFPALLSGAAVCPFDLKTQGIQALAAWIEEQKITVYHSVPTVFRYFTASLAEDARLPSVRLISMGAETIKPGDLAAMARYFPNAIFSHMYGQTESSLNTMVSIAPSAGLEKVPLGAPIPGVQVLLLNEEGEEVGELEIGELFVASPYLALEYYKNPEASHATFLNDEELGRIYRTGDLARRDLDGDLVFCGRKDQQIKIRGFRVEPGEIENALLGIETVKEAVVTPFMGQRGDWELCAYVVLRPREERQTLDSNQLKDLLSKTLPDYMVPAYVVGLESLPVTANGKLNRQALPKPDVARALDYAPPQTAIQKRLIAVWSDVLRLPAERIGIDDHFFRLGGHSLKATLLAAHIYREFNVKAPLTELFRLPTVRQQELLVAQGGAAGGWPIEPVEKKEYFPLSSSQARLFFLHGSADRGTGFHMSAALRAFGPLDERKIESVFAELLKRHDMLRSSFIYVDDAPVQRVWDETGFRLHHCRLNSPLNERGIDPAQVVDETGNPFIKPYDLATPPLFRAGIVKLQEDDFLLVFDMHHIIGDGTSMGILVGDITRLYRDDAMPPLRLQYSDFAVWQQNMFESGHMDDCRRYWKGIYHDAPDIPRSDLPADFPRHSPADFSGGIARRSLSWEATAALRKLGETYGATLYMTLLAVLNVVVYKYTGLEDIIVGTAVSGRPHAGLDEVIGMFVNILPMRNFPHPHLPFKNFLAEVATRTIDALEYQDMPFDLLVRDLRLKTDSRRHPLYSVCLTVQNYRAGSLDLDGVTVAPIDLKKNKSNIDINIFAFELQDVLQISIQYLAGRFRHETMESFIHNLIQAIGVVCRDDSVIIRDIELLPDESQSQAAADIKMDMDFCARLEDVCFGFEE